LAVLVGPEHTWAKLLSVGIFALIVFLAFARGTYRAQASFVLEATEQHTLCAPFDGFLKDVRVEVGDSIEANQTVLAALDTAELRLQLAAAEAEKAGYLKEMSAAMRDGETARAQIAEANADKAQAQIDLTEYFLGRAEILAPASGTVVTGDLKRQIGAPVKTGDALFEIAPLASLRAELRVPEDQIFDIAVDQRGYLATVSYPSRRIEFVVERIDPAADLIENRNVFTVRARLLDVQPWMRPGMEGVAKVTVGKRHYVWIWTRKLVNWIRMKLWI
jgi:multidrug efflux pump subunit AcrA (membrane-fusion protein)